MALASGEGFIKVTGEVGTGKTLLLRKLLDDLAVEYQLAYLPNPYLTPMSFAVHWRWSWGLRFPVMSWRRLTLSSTG